LNPRRFVNDVKSVLVVNRDRAWGHESTVVQALSPPGQYIFGSPRCRVSATGQDDENSDAKQKGRAKNQT
jgi:hypothetical protein